MKTYRCPTWKPRLPEDSDLNLVEYVKGCGHVFEAETDEEGLVDCPNCGIWFNPQTEPETVVRA